jgi:hypothetical protein
MIGEALVTGLPTSVENSMNDDIAILVITGFSSSESEKCYKICKKESPYFYFRQKNVSTIPSLFNSKRKKPNSVRKLRDSAFYIISY